MHNIKAESTVDSLMKFPVGGGGANVRTDEEDVWIREKQPVLKNEHKS